jgi:predicted  nucleic acid-binding Zn-ribbon protein
MPDDISTTMLESVAQDVGRQWNENQELLAGREIAVQSIKIDLNQAKSRTARALQSDSGIRIEIQGLRTPFENDLTVPQSVLSRIKTLEERAVETKKTLDAASIAEAQWQKDLTAAEDSVAESKKEAERLQTEIVQVRNKIAALAAQKN